MTNTEKYTSVSISQERQSIDRSRVEAFTCKNYRNGKAISITYSECVHVFLPHLSSIQSACTLLYCCVWPVRLYHIFPHYLIFGTIFRKVAERKTWVLIFLTNFSWNISIPRRTECDMIKNVNCSSCKLSVISVLFKWN